ncbi:hypothetical protein ANCDUO_20003, partial [Ancylostoma duodenale]
MAVFEKDPRDYSHDVNQEEKRQCDLEHINLTFFPYLHLAEVKDCDKMSFWLSQAGWERLRDADEAGTMK